MVDWVWKSIIGVFERDSGACVYINLFVWVACRDVRYHLRL